MKSKQSKNLVIAALSLVALIAVFLLVFQLLKEDNAPPEAIPVFSTDENGIERVSVVGGETDEDYTLIRDSIGEDGTPKFRFEDPDPNFDYFDNSFTRLPNAVSAVCADKVVEESPDESALRKYGLSPAKTTVTIELDGGKTVRLLLGILAGTNDGYYMMLEGDSVIYEISLDAHTELSIPESYYRNFEILPDVETSLTDLAYIKLTLPDGTVAFEAETPTFEPESYNGRATSLYIKQPFEDYCSLASLWNKAMSYFYQETAHYGYVEDYPKDLEKYGLVNCYRIDIRNVGGEELSLRIATEKNEAGYYYAYKEDQPSIIQLDGQFEFFKNDALDYVASNIWLYEAKGISTIEITGEDGKTHIVDYHRTGDSGDTANVTLDGKPISEVNTRNLYTRILFVSMIGACEPVDSQPKLSIAVNLINGDRHELKLRPINEREFAAELDGETRYMVNIVDLKNITDALDLLLSGKNIE